MFDMAYSLLGGLKPTTFLRRHWQKRPLHVRHALPDCGAWLEPEMLFKWALRDDVESRLVMHQRGRWHVQHGPFRRAQWVDLPARGWTLLVQGVERLLPQGAALLQAFSFIPHARLDDLMASYAPPGSGVGPHFDSYDVFLLQGAGTRRWRVSAQRNRTLVTNAPMRILKDFRATQEWITSQGDLIYLPPNYAHEGVAIEPCITLSVGFRAPRAQELAAGFLEFLQDELRLDGIYADPDLRPQRHPSEIPATMLKKFARSLQRLRWNAGDIQRFAGRYLTEPKAHVTFEPPRRAQSLTSFRQRLARRGIQLAPSTRMLFHGRYLFINGEQHTIESRDRAALIRLADRRETPAFAANASTARLLHTWYRAGYVEFSES